MRPSHRAIEDEKRIAKHKSRKDAMPGPGTYSPMRLGTTREALAGSSAFKSKLDRAQPQPSTAVLNEVGDPGAYEDPKGFLSVATQSKATARTLNKAGKAGFGGTEKRSLLLSNIATKPPSNGWTGAIEDTPGPAAHDSLVDERGREHNMYTMSSGEKMKSSSVASTMQRPGVVLKSAYVPGPGAYDPKDHLTVNNLPGCLLYTSPSPRDS